MTRTAFYSWDRDKHPGPDNADRPEQVTTAFSALEAIERDFHDDGAVTKIEVADLRLLLAAAYEWQDEYGLAELGSAIDRIRQAIGDA